MLKCVAEFLKGNWDGHRPLLLGYSGGPDSKALLYALLEAGCKTLHLAHVDHGWRPESAREAEELKNEALRLGLPFHTIRLDQPSASNKEAVAREARLAFFRTLFTETPFQALLLAHQAGDVAETALKRVLEGAHLPFLGGMEPIGQIQGLNVWRPLLSVKKEEIIAFLEKKNLEPFIDSTNFNPAYLRARMRVEILPFLGEAFGKEISDNLLLLSCRSSELKAYLDKKTETLTPERGPWGLFGYIADRERLEARYLLQKWAEIEKIRLPRSLLEMALDAGASKRANCSISSRVVADRGYLFFLGETSPSWGTDPLPLAPGSWTWGDWTIDVKEDQTPRESSWKDVWSGRFTVHVPQGWLSMPPVGTDLRHLWNKEKVPAFFRYRVPIVTNAKGRSKEFLTGKKLSEIEPYYKLAISTCSAPTP